MRVTFAVFTCHFLQKDFGYSCTFLKNTVGQGTQKKDGTQHAFSFLTFHFFSGNRHPPPSRSPPRPGILLHPPSHRNHPYQLLSKTRLSIKLSPFLIHYCMAGAALGDLCRLVGRWDAVAALEGCLAKQAALTVCVKAFCVERLLCNSTSVCKSSSVYRLLM